MTVENEYTGILIEAPRFEFTKDAPEDIQELGLPSRKTVGSAGYDFVCPCDISIPPHGTAQFMTYIKAYIPKNLVLILVPRSSTGMKKRLSLANTVGVIDSDYYSNPTNDGNIGVLLVNNSNETKFLKRGEAFMQGIFMQYFVTADDQTQGVRVGGIGSTDSAEIEIAIPVS